MHRNEAEASRLSRRDFLLRAGVGGAATALLYACGGLSTESGPPSRADLEKLLANSLEQHARMEVEINNVDRLMDNLQAAADAVIGIPVDDRLFQPFVTHKINRDTNPDRNFYTRIIKNTEHLLAGGPVAALQRPSLVPAHYTYGYIEREKDERLAGYSFATRSIETTSLDPDNLLDGLTLFHETAHPYHDGLWIAATEGSEAGRAEYAQFAASNPAILEMEGDASLKELNMLNLLTGGRYLDAVSRGRVRFSDFQRTLGARADQAQEFEGTARELAVKAGIDRGGFVNSVDFSRAIEKRYKGLGPVKRQADFTSAPDFLTA